MDFGISLNTEIHRIACESITDDNYEDFHVSLESLNDEVIAMWESFEHEISTENVITNAFKQIKAFILKLVRYVVGAVKMFWNKRTIKKICNIMNTKVVPMSLSGQVIWFIETIMKNNVDPKLNGTESLESLDDKYFFNGMEESETGIPGVRDRERSPDRHSIDFEVKDIHANHASLLLLMCASRRICGIITLYAKEMESISKKEIGANVDAFIKALPDDVKGFIANGGTFGKNNYTKTAAADIIFKSIDTAKNDTYIRNMMSEFGGIRTSRKFTLDDMNDSSANEITWRALINLHNKLDIIIEKLKNAGKNVSSAGTLTQYYKTLAAEQKTELDKMMKEVMGVDKLFDSAGVTLIGRTLTELVRFYNLFAIKTAWCMNVATEANKEQDLKLMFQITKAMGKQTKELMKTCVGMLKSSIR